MKNIRVSDQVKRAVTVIKADRLGVSAGIEKVISSEVKKVLGEFFCLNEDVETLVEIDQRGFKITISANAFSIKGLKVVE